MTDAQSSLHRRSLQWLIAAGRTAASWLAAECVKELMALTDGSVTAILPQRASQAIVNTCVLTITANNSHHVFLRNILDYLISSSSRSSNPKNIFGCVKSVGRNRGEDGCGNALLRRQPDSFLACSVSAFGAIAANLQACDDDFVIALPLYLAFQRLKKIANILRNPAAAQAG